MGRALEDGKTSVAQSYIQYGWLETGATPLEEKIIDYSIMCIRQDPQKGYREFKELSDSKKFLKRVVDQVYSKDPQNVSKILTFVDLIDDLEQKLLIIWALFDQITLNDDTVGAKSCLDKLQEINVIIDGNGNFSECDLWQIKLMDHQLNRLQLTAQASAQNNLELIAGDLKTFINQKFIDTSIKLDSLMSKKAFSENSKNLATIIDEKLTDNTNNLMDFIGEKIGLCNINEIIHKTFKICHGFFAISSESYAQNQVIYLSRCKINDDEKRYIPCGDHWILEKFPNQNDQTFFLKSLNFGGYLRATSELICIESNDKKCFKIQLDKNKEVNNYFEWKLIHYEFNGFSIATCSMQNYYLSIGNVLKIWDKDGIDHCALQLSPCEFQWSFV